jgi:2-keto-4-pentenoate hydratase/2-oxohepta-3-ene-1,7-dioic acid hydratase in catechol pathway
MTIAALYDCSFQLTGEGRRLNEVKIQAPIPRPMGTIMCIGKNYLDHVKEVDTWKSAPGISTPEAPKVGSSALLF